VSGRKAHRALPPCCPRAKPPVLGKSSSAPRGDGSHSASQKGGSAGDTPLPAAPRSPAADAGSARARTPPSTPLPAPLSPPPPQPQSSRRRLCRPAPRSWAVFLAWKGKKNAVRSGAHGWAPWTARRGDSGEPCHQRTDTLSALLCACLERQWRLRRNWGVWEGGKQPA